MTSKWITASLVLVAVVVGVAEEELPELPKGCLAGDPSYSAGDLTGAVLGTLIVTLLLLALGYAIYRMYWRGRRGKHLVLVTDAERGVGDDYAFDNPCFRDGTPIGRSGYEKEPVKLDQKNNRWSAWSPLGALVGHRNEKRRALDDSFTGEPQVSVVSLRSHDFTGLGFNVCGNMRDGIFVKDVLHRGPASESGRITSGDRIDSIRISFRHMVFEDALTILSYASPYEVQLEVENPSPSSRPSTLIRTKRSSIEPADRICHPFYRSQSIADLAQIGKASLKPVQDMGGAKSPKTRIESWDEKRAGEYPTLKLSPTPTPMKETVKLEKTANPTTPTGAAIVKPERVRKPAPQASAADNTATAESGKENKEAKPDSAGKHQRFGIRVLPDPKAINLKSTLQDGKTGSTAMHKPEIVGNVGKTNPMVGDKSAKTYNVLEAERRENERNSMVEKSNVVPSSKNTVVSGEVNPSKKMKSSLNEDTVDNAPKVVRSLTYDERGIDVGPAEEEEENKRKASVGSEQAAKAEDGSKKSKEGEGHSNVKLLLTKGLQNLKEKLHHIDKKKVGPSPEPDLEVGANPSEDKKGTSKSVKNTKSESSDSDGDKKEKKKSKPAKLTQQNGSKEDLKNMTKKEDVKKEDNMVKEEPEKDEISNEGKIPTEMPENVRRAAMAARHNRRSLITDSQVLSVGQEVSDNAGEAKPKTIESKPEPSEAKAVPVSGSAEDTATNPLFPTVKYRMRKEESLSEDSSGDDLGTGISSRNDEAGQTPRKSNKRKAPVPPAKEGDDKTSDPTTIVTATTAGGMSDAQDINGNLGQPDTGVKVVQQHEKTNGDENIRTMEVHIETNSHQNSKFADIPKQQNSPPSNNEITNIAVDNSTTVLPSMPAENNGPSKTIGLSDELTITVETAPSKMVIDSDSDSDDEAIDKSLRKAAKKGGTTIELNSSHITIHHSPSSDTVTLELEGDSTRKAASMGDLSRLETEQPMSTLERAVSLDLADGGVPSCKKRKAPPPPPSEDFPGTAVDAEDSTIYRKEPRLDNALDTFQRRRLKKSSDWGTMEDAVQQTPPDSPRKSLASPTNIHVNMFDNEPTSLTISIGDDVDDAEVFLESSPLAHQPMDVDAASSNVASFPVASARTFETTRAYLNSTSDRDRPAQISSVSVRRVETSEEPPTSLAESHSSQRTVLLITPEPVNVHDVISTSKITLAQPASSGPSSLVEDQSVESSSPIEDLQIGGSRLLGLIRSELRNGMQSLNSDASEPDTSGSEPAEISSTIVSSTPIARRDPRRQQVETIQSSRITSSNPGIQNVNVVSSTTHSVVTATDPDGSASSDMSNISATAHDSVADESNVSVTSTSEAFLTAASIVDSTTTFIATSDDDSTFEHESQPPELPTSPVPILNSAYNPSSSMTYITEIQVTTMSPEKETATEVRNGVEEEMPMASVSESRERLTSGSQELAQSEVEEADSGETTVASTFTNGDFNQLRNNVNVTVTSIRNAVTSPDRSKIPTRIGTDGIMTTFHSGPSSIERSQIPMRVSNDSLVATFASPTHTEVSHIPMRMSSGGVLTTFTNNRTSSGSAGSPERSQIPMRIVSPGSLETSPVGNNGISEKKSKAARPPVPPRKSDSSMSSVITVDVPNSNRSPDNAQTLATGSSNAHTSYGFSPNTQNSGGSKKYISFSSLTPRPVSGDASNRNSSSFEQWVFLDEAQSNGNSHNGTETSGDEATQHSTVVTMPVSVTSSSRPPSVTHIVMDSKQSSGKRGSQ